MAAMTATTRVDFGLVKGLGAGVGRKAARAMTHASAARRTTGRINAVRTQSNANVGWGRESLGGSESLVRSSVGSLRVSSPRYLAPTKTPTTKHTTTTLRRAIGGSGSFDEGDPSETPALVSKQSEESAGDLKEVAFWVAAACLFGAGVGLVEGPQKAEEFFSGYLLEQSLSVDNLFVFVLVFEYFKVPPTQQTKVLSYGIGGAVVMRALMIVAGYEAITNFKPVLLVFAGILIFSSYKLITESGEEEDEDMSENAIVQFCSKLLPVSEAYDGDNFWTEVKDEKTNEIVKMATPLLLCLCVIELSDVVFAVDSIPAVFGVTQDPLIVYSSNIFAILGLRSLYAFVAQMVAELEYLQTAVAAVLGFVGCKMVAGFGGYEISTEASLAVVVGMLGAGVALSLYKKDDDETETEK